MFFDQLSGVSGKLSVRKLPASQMGEEFLAGAGGKFGDTVSGSLLGLRFCVS